MVDLKKISLTKIINGVVFASLDGAEAERLRKQLHYTILYSAILGERIEAFTD